MPGPNAPSLTDWDRILSLYDDLVRLNPSPVIQLNRAVALVARRRTGGRARRAARRSPDDPTLANYYLLPSVTARLFAELGDDRARDRQLPAGTQPAVQRARAAISAAPTRAADEVAPGSGANWRVREPKRRQRGAAPHESILTLATD